MATDGAVGRVIDILGLGQVEGILISSVGAVVYSHSFVLPSGDPSFAFIFGVESEGNVAVKLELEQSDVLPATEGAADSNYVVPDGASEIVESLTNENRHIKAFLPAATSYGRVKATALEGNDASATISELKLSYIKNK